MAEAPALTTETFPYDLDTTSIGLSVTHADDQTARLVMNEILQYRNEDGIVMVSPLRLLLSLSIYLIRILFRHTSITDDLASIPSSA